MAELAAASASSSPPHVVIFPLPAQGHVNSMLKLAELLSLHGIRITFLNSERIHQRLLQNSDVQSRFSSSSGLGFGFEFKVMSDGLTKDPCTDEEFMLLFNNLKESSRCVVEDIVRCGAKEGSPVSCIIADGSMSFVIDVGQHMGVPVIIFRTISACCFCAYFYIPQLIQNGQLPIRGTNSLYINSVSVEGKEDMDRVINIPGGEGLLRCRDLPSFCRSSDVSSWSLMEYLATQTCQSTRAQGIIFNSFEELEHPLLDHIRSHLLTSPNHTKLYAVGPLHLHLKSRLLFLSNNIQTNTNSLFQEDTTCLTWLDKQPPKSVIYVSFGSIAVLTPQQLTEFMFGLINTKCRFLWVIRSDSVADDKKSATPFPEEVKAAIEERGCIVKWAPQEVVLGHPAVGGFVTHSGWNSTLESMSMGVPMVCWPYFADQQVNSRYVSEVWKTGVDMKDECDRNVVERMINDVMLVERRRAEFCKAAADKASLANQAVTQGGSSWEDLNRLISDIFSFTIPSSKD